MPEGGAEAGRALPGSRGRLALTARSLPRWLQLLTAAAPPPTTITEPASARRSWAERSAAPISSADWKSGWRQNPLVTPVEMTSASYVSAELEPSSCRTRTLRAARSSPVKVPWTVRTRSRPRNLSNGIQLARAQSCGRDSRQPSSCPLTNAGLAEIPITSAWRASLIAVSTPLSPRPAMTMRLRFIPTQIEFARASATPGSGGQTVTRSTSGYR